MTLVVDTSSDPRNHPESCDHTVLTQILDQQGLELLIGRSSGRCDTELGRETCAATSVSRDARPRARCRRRRSTLDVEDVSAALIGPRRRQRR